MEGIMIKVISIFLFAFLLCSNIYAQEETFGYRLSDNSDIVSDVFLIQNGFVLDSILSYPFNNLEYSFDYYDSGKLKRDFNFISFTLIDSSSGFPRPRHIGGSREYFYNARGDVDSICSGYWYNDQWHDSLSYRIDYTYDNDGKILTKTYLNKGEVTKIEENIFDSSDNLILNKVIDPSFQDTTYNIREFDSLNRLTLVKSITSLPYFYQYVFQYDTLGNIISKYQYVDSAGVQPARINYMEFDESDKLIHETVFAGYYPDSTWRDTIDLVYDYDEYGRILSSGPNTWFTYNTDGNLDSLISTHISFGYLDMRATFVDSYGNSITFPSYYTIYSLRYHKLVTGIKKPKFDEMNFTLSQNYPNPFNPTTTINFLLNVKSNVQLTIYDITGREVKTLINQSQNRGRYSIPFNASGLASGVYIYRLKAGSTEQSRKMLLLR